MTDRNAVLSRHADEMRAREQAHRTYEERRREEDIRLRNEGRNAYIEAIESEQQAKRDAQIAAESETVKDGLRVRFLLNPGASEQDFEQAYPRLLEDHRIQRTLNGDADLLREARQSGDYDF